MNHKRSRANWYTAAVVFFFFNRLGCVGSLLVSLALTLALLFFLDLV